DLANAERHRARVQLREVAVEEVLDDRLLTRGEDVLRNLAAGFERLARERHLAARAGELELQLPLVGEHDEPALRAGDVDGRIEHEREYVFEDAPGSERAQALEQRRHLAQLGRRGDRALFL